MSVTFEASMGPVVGSKIDCGCPDVTPVEFDSYDEAASWLDAWLVSPTLFDGCTNDLCLDYAPYISPRTLTDEHSGVNISQFNARVVFEALGIDADSAFTDGGVMEAEDFLGRVMLAQAAAPVSAEIPAHASVNNPNFINCGRSEGYVQTRLDDLRDLAEFAVEHHRTVQFG